MATAPETKQADGRGRISLGREYANRTFLVEEIEGSIVIRPARVIPEQEAWLYRNPVALEMVRQGLDQARRREPGRAPNVDRARKLVDTIPDE